MANRREFLQGTLAVSALPILTSATATAFSASNTSALHTAVYDERHAASHEFAREMRARGIRAQAIRGDVTQLWFAELHDAWRKTKAPVAGLTEASALFCLERLAWDYQMRVVYHEEHHTNADGALIASTVARVPSNARPLVTALGPYKANATLYSWIIAPARAAAAMA